MPRPRANSDDYKPQDEKTVYGSSPEELLAQETKLSEEINYLSTQINSVDKLREEREQIYAEDDRYFRTMDERRERRNANGGGSEEQNRMSSSQFDEFSAKMEEHKKRINEIDVEISEKMDLQVSMIIQKQEAEKKLEEVRQRMEDMNIPTVEKMDTF